MHFIRVELIFLYVIFRVPPLYLCTRIEFSHKNYGGIRVNEGTTHFFVTFHTHYLQLLLRSRLGTRGEPFIATAGT